MGLRAMEGPLVWVEEISTNKEVVSSIPAQIPIWQNSYYWEVTGQRFVTQVDLRSFTEKRRKENGEFSSPEKLLEAESQLPRWAGSGVETSIRRAGQAMPAGRLQDDASALPLASSRDELARSYDVPDRNPEIWICM